MPDSMNEFEVLVLHVVFFRKYQARQKTCPTSEYSSAMKFDRVYPAEKICLGILIRELAVFVRG